MIVFRIEREKYLETTLSIIGASMTEGFRWNSLYTKLIYTAASRALATLAVAVHLDLNEDLPDDRFYVEIEIPNNIKMQEVELEDLPENWNSKPPNLVTQVIGDDFITQNFAAVLKVPGSIVPQEFNYLINPNHPDAKKLKIISKISMNFDSRLKI